VNPRLVGTGGASYYIVGSLPGCGAGGGGCGGGVLGPVGRGVNVGIG